MLDSIARHQALIDTVEGRREWTWDILCAPLEEAEYLTAAGYDVARWSATVFERFFSNDALRDPRIIQCFHNLNLSLFFNNTLRTFANQTRFAAQIATFGTLLEPVRDLALTTPILDNWWHMQLQLEVGSLGQREEGQITFEDPLGNGRTGDVKILYGSSQVLVEAMSLQPSDAQRKASACFRQVIDQVLDLRLRYSVYVTKKGPLARRDVVLPAEVEITAELVARDGITRYVPSAKGSPWKVSQEPPAAAEVELEGLVVDPKAWRRLGTALSGKNKQYKGADPTWIRLAIHPDVWLCMMPMYLASEERLDVLVSLLCRELACFPNLKGVIVSQPPTGTSHARALKDNSISVRCPLPGYLVREVTITPRLERFTAEAEMLAGWYEKEDTLLDWLLDQSGQPAFNALIRDPK